MAWICSVCPFCVLKRKWPGSLYARTLVYVEKCCPFCRAYRELRMLRPRPDYPQGRSGGRSGRTGTFMTSILINPFAAGRYPGEHATSGPYKWLPAELSLINDLPTNTDRKKFRQRFEDGYLGYFLDNNTWGKERHRGVGFWVKGATRAEMVVRTAVPVDRLTVRVLNVSVANRVEVCVSGECRIDDYEPGEKKILEFPAGRGFPYENFGARSYCYVVTIEPEHGEIPKLMRRGEKDSRFLGAFIHIEPDPYPAI